MSPLPLARWRLGGSLFAAIALAGASCKDAPPEPAPAPTAYVPRGPEVHVIVEKDHRHVTHIAAGDTIELPHEPEFAWTIKFENDGFFDPAPLSDAGLERYKAVRSGLVRALASGDPKICMHSDAPCTLAKYAWSLTFQID